MEKYLNLTGLEQYHDLVLSLIDTIEEVTAAALVDLEERKADKRDIPTVPTNISSFTNDSGYVKANTYGTVYVETASSYNKTATIPMSYSLRQGNTFILCLKVNNTRADATLKINTTDAKPVRIDGVATTSSNWKAGMYLCYYDGTYYQMKSDTNPFGSSASISGNTITIDGNSVTVPTVPTTMGASGSGHKGGLVPDTPSTAGTSKFLREDGTWAEPSGGSGELIHPLSSVSGTAAVTTDPYTCSKWAGTATGVTSLYDGLIVSIKVPVAGNATYGTTLNINSLGEHPILLNVSTMLSTQYAVDCIIELTYDAEATANVYLNSDSATTITGCWKIADYNTNTTYTNAKLGQGYATCTTAAATAAKVATLSSYSLTTGGIVTVKFSYDVPANATLSVNNQTAKAIYYKGAKITAGVIKAGDFATFIYSSYYHLISLNRNFDDAFGGSGSSHSSGLVPDPGSTAGTTKFLREDGTWSVPSYPTTLPASDVYSWAKASTKPTYTASEVGLGNVGNYKAVSTVANQGLSSTEMLNARENIGAGTSSFSGSYTDLSNKPTIPAAQVQSDWNATSGMGVILNKPSFLPANGGNSNTVNNHTVNADVPSDAVFTDTTYSIMGASGTNHASGLVPDTPSTAGTTKFLREDGTWEVPAYPAAQVQSDWNATSGMGEILNKPSTLPTPVSSVSGSSVSQALTPNTHYVFGTVTSLTVTLGAAVSGVVNEYTFEFDSGSTATTLSVPSTVLGIDTTSVEASTHYEVNIKYNATTNKYYGLMYGWEA